MFPRLRFKKFDGDWTAVTLESLAEVERGKFSVRPRNDPRYFGGEMPFIQTGDVTGSDVYLKGYTQTLNDDGIRVSKVFPADTILITIAANIGDTTITQYPVACPDSVVAIQPKQDKVNTIFLKNVIDLQKDNLDSQATQNAQKNINLQVLKPLKLIVPLKEEQTQIASFLSAVDEKISQLTQKHQLLSQYKQGMMQKLFSQQIRFKADDGSEFGEWECIQANSIFENYSNKNHDGSLTILAATQDKGVVPRDEIDIDIKSSDASVLSYKIIEKGNFVISLRSFQGGIEYSNYEGICSPAYTVLKAIKPIHTGFYKAYLKTNDFIQRLSSTVIGIRDGKQISYQAFSTLMIDYPCPEEQTKIANFLSAIDQKIEVVAQQIEQAKQWKKGLLQQMFI